MYGSLTYRGVNLQSEVAEHAKGLLGALSNPGVVWASRQRCLGVAVANLEMSPHELHGLWDTPRELLGWVDSVTGSDGGVQAANAARMLRPAARMMRPTWDLVALGTEFTWDKPLFDVADLSQWGDCPREGAVYSYDGRNNYIILAVDGLRPRQNHLVARHLAEFLRLRKSQINQG